MEKMFEKALRKKFRFPTNKGLLTTEDLWDLPLTGQISLDSLAKNLNRQLKDCQESFVEKKSDKNVDLEHQFEIVKYIIDYKLKMAEAKKKERETKEKKQKIMQIIMEKEVEDLKSQSVDDLKKMLDEL